jgi:hypothetical protein
MNNNCFENQVEIRGMYDIPSLYKYKEWTKVSEFLGMGLMGVEMRKITK